MKSLLAVLLIVALLAGAALAYSALDRGTPVEAAAVSLGPVREFVDEEGKTRLPNVHLVTMPYDGRIEAIDLVEGAAVKKDQVVARRPVRAEHRGGCRPSRGRSARGLDPRERRRLG